MTRDEYYALLKERWEKVDKTSREAIHEFNEWKRELRRQMDEETADSHLNAPYSHSSKTLSPIGMPH